ncbi:MAG TPA: maleylacetoacetate isomerase [Gammaproteobacteria bacterium]|nr:maleylacetoacetate isomerase [Gammaproteobacteria bacterium]
MELYGYWRSSAAYRVRIALHLKGLQATQHFVNLRADEQGSEVHRRLDPLGRVPVLVDDGHRFTQSLAILEYLEERYPAPPLLPAAAADRTRVRALAQIVACDMHPLNNLSTLRYLQETLGVSDEQKTAWYRYWIASGFTALEAMLAGDRRTGMFCHGDSPGLADVCLVPQLYNARRFDCDLAAYPTIVRVDATCAKLDAFAQAVPEAQADAAL